MKTQPIYHYMNLKLTYLLLAIVFLASSCSSDTADDIRLSKKAEVSFNVSDLSRASVTSSIDQFLVYGDTKPLSTGTSIPVLLFNPTKVVYKNGSWSYDGIQYWIPNYEHSFVALSPVELFETGNSPRYLNSRLTFDYSIPTQNGILSSNDMVTDILLATHRRLYEEVDDASPSNDKITFKFSHLLSLINFAPAFYDNNLNSDDYILIHKLEFSGIKTKAQFNIEPAQRLSNYQTDDMDVEVVPQEEGKIAIEFSSPVKIENTGINVKLFADNDAIIMLPQNFDATSDTKITLTYSLNEEESLKEGFIMLNNLKWESGKSYVYNFIIERIGVIFNTCEINPWNLIKGEEITVD